MIVLDTSVVVAWLRGLDTLQTRLLVATRRARTLVVGDLVLAEVLQGARDDAHAAVLEGRLGRFRAARMVDAASAARAAWMYRTLRAAGTTPRGLVDLLIAAYCIGAGLPLLHADRDFDAVERHCGLRVARGRPAL